MCPCGRGPVQVVHTRDGLEHLYVCCADCARELDQKKEMQREQERKDLLRLQVLIAEIYAYFDSRYLGHWVKHFALTPSKKAVWEELRQFKVISSGKTAFYEQLRGGSLEDYLRRRACISAMGQILVLMEIYDPYLTGKIEEALELAGEQYKYLVTSRESWKE